MFGQSANPRQRERQRERSTPAPVPTQTTDKNGSSTNSAQRGHTAPACEAAPTASAASTVPKLSLGEKPRTRPLESPRKIENKFGGETQQDRNKARRQRDRSPAAPPAEKKGVRFHPDVKDEVESTGAASAAPAHSSAPAHSAAPSASGQFGGETQQDRNKARRQRRKEEEEAAEVRRGSPPREQRMQARRELMADDEAAHAKPETSEDAPLSPRFGGGPTQQDRNKARRQRDRSPEVPRASDEVAAAGKWAKNAANGHQAPVEAAAESVAAAAASPPVSPRFGGGDTQQDRNRERRQRTRAEGADEVAAAGKWAKNAANDNQAPVEAAAESVAAAAASPPVCRQQHRIRQRAANVAPAAESSVSDRQAVEEAAAVRRRSQEEEAARRRHEEEAAAARRRSEAEAASHRRSQEQAAAARKGQQDCHSDSEAAWRQKMEQEEAEWQRAMAADETAHRNKLEGLAAERRTAEDKAQRRHLAEQMSAQQRRGEQEAGALTARSMAESPREYTAPAPTAEPVRPYSPQKETNSDAVFVTMDLNGDGVVDAAEFDLAVRTGLVALPEAQTDRVWIEKADGSPMYMRRLCAETPMLNQDARHQALLAFDAKQDEAKRQYSVSPREGSMPGALGHHSTSVALPYSSPAGSRAGSPRREAFLSPAKLVLDLVSAALETIEHQDPQVKIAFEIEEARRIRNQQEAEKQELEELILVQHLQKAKIADTRAPPSLRRPLSSRGSETDYLASLRKVSSSKVLLMGKEGVTNNILDLLHQDSKR